MLTTAPYQPLNDLDDGITPSSPKAETGTQKLSLAQTDALKRVMVYHQNYQEELSNGVGETEGQHTNAVQAMQAALEKEIANALKQNVELSALSQQLDSLKTDASKLLGAFFDKAKDHPDFRQAKQAYYLQQIKSLGFQIRYQHPVYTSSSSVIELNQQLLDNLHKYQAVGGDVTQNLLLDEYKLPLGTVFKFISACKEQKDHAPEQTSCHSARK
jgi:hypothetical protein